MRKLEDVVVKAEMDEDRCTRCGAALNRRPLGGVMRGPGGVGGSDGS